LTPPFVYVLILFVPAPPATAAPTNPADPQQDRAAAAGDPPNSRIGRLLGLVRKLILYGKELASTLQQQPSAETLFHVTLRFGTVNIALILARITRGLRIAAALEARLAPRAARPEPVRAPARPRSPRKPRAARPPSRPQDDDTASLLDRIPTAEEIAVQLRRRPFGAVLVDICGDLGITATHPLWRDITWALIENNGSQLALLKDVFKRTSLTNFLPPDTPLVPPMPPGWLPPHLVSAATAATGPP
jgi:hypothetical protein